MTIFYHYFHRPLPYVQTLALQEKIYQINLLRRRFSAPKDILLLLQHRPVYTAGRRQTESSIEDERTRLTKIGADFVTTARGGQLTYHGPGQIVGYPLLDLAGSSPTIGIRDYVCHLQKTLEGYLHDAHGIKHAQSEHTGVFLDPTTKIASIGVQVRHRLTTHGFAINITKEPLAWFDRVVACGLDDVRAGCVENASDKKLSVSEEIPSLVDAFGKQFHREMVKLDLAVDAEIGDAILALERIAEQAGDWQESPSVSS